MLSRPAAGEYDEYYDLYVRRVPDGDILEIIDRQITDTNRFLLGIGEEKAKYRYAPDKWSIKQVAGHLSDIERLFQYRAVAFARNDRTPLPSIDQDDYLSGANFDDRALEDIAEEYRLVRTSGLALFRSFDDEISLRTGTASGFTFTVRSIPYILAGHEIHHVGVIKERYL